MKGSTVLLLVLTGLFLMDNKKVQSAPAVTTPVDKVAIAPVASAPVPDLWTSKVPVIIGAPVIDLIGGGVMWPGGDAPGSGGPEDPLGPSDPNWMYRPVMYVENSGIRGEPVYSAL